MGDRSHDAHADDHAHGEGEHHHHDDHLEHGSYATGQEDEGETPEKEHRGDFAEGQQAGPHRDNPKGLFLNIDVFEVMLT